MDNYQKLFALLLGVLAVPGSVVANGGPFETSPVIESGNLEPTVKKEITLDEEVLHITLDGDYVDVEVEYTFTNHGQADKVSYGFPVDLIHTTDEEGYYLEYLEKNRKDAVTSFTISDKSGSLEYRIVDSDEGFDLAFPFQAQFEYDTAYALRRWYMTDVNFPANAKKKLYVSYRIRALYQDWGTNKSFTPSYYPRVFVYDLSPSGNWGNGVCKKYKVTVDAREEVERGAEIGTILLPGTPSLENSVYTYQAEDINLTESENIVISYDISAYRARELFEILRAKRDVIKSLRVSSVGGEQYGAWNMFDGDLATAWVEGAEGLGIGEWIEVEFTRGLPFLGVGLINGYMKSEVSYYDNASVSRMKMELWDSRGERINQDFYQDIELRDIEYSDFGEKGFSYFMNYLEIHGETHNRVSKVRLTILDAYPGAKWKDLCISELYVFYDATGAYTWDELE
ncbi:hypothetical protein JXM67_14700 [candidate division WOR-3 bacterium]|nr:hypothetical protein [candidate division WOR-3 bacterium]